MAYFPSPNISKSIGSKNKLKLSDIREEPPKRAHDCRAKYITPPEAPKLSQTEREELSTHFRREYLKNLGGVIKPNYSLQEITNRLENVKANNL